MGLGLAGAGVGLSRCFVKVPPLPLQDSGWEGCFFSRGGLFSHLAVLFDERPEIKNVRAKALRSLAAKAQAVVGSGECSGGSLEGVLVKRDKPHACGNAAALSSRLLWAVYTVVVSEGRLLFGSAYVPSGVYFTLAVAAVVCLESWYAEIRLIICKPSSVFVFPCMVFY